MRVLLNDSHCSWPSLKQCTEMRAPLVWISRAVAESRETHTENRTSVTVTHTIHLWPCVGYLYNHVLALPRGKPCGRMFGTSPCQLGGTGLGTQSPVYPVSICMQPCAVGLPGCPGLPVLALLESSDSACIPEISQRVGRSLEEVRASRIGFQARPGLQPMA